MLPLHFLEEAASVENYSSHLEISTSSVEEISTSKLSKENIAHEVKYNERHIEDNIVLDEEERDAASRFFQMEAVLRCKQDDGNVQNAVHIWSNIPSVNSKYSASELNMDLSLLAENICRSRIFSQRKRKLPLPGSLVFPEVSRLKGKGRECGQLFGVCAPPVLRRLRGSRWLVAEEPPLLFAQLLQTRPGHGGPPRALWTLGLVSLGLEIC
ncbi:dnmt3l [Crotalus adamanteus]|uniref:Dnmt3l n=1 Tax=Crotalus adamanteus TaxID=8729 RepID=A0AAW1BIH1_CROAD